MTAKTYININGDVRDPSALTVPQDRTFRSAWQLNGDTVEVDPVKKQEILTGMVNEERKNRLEKGKKITVTGYGDVAMQGRDQDQITIVALEASSHILMSQGVTQPVLPFRDADNVSHLLTPEQAAELMYKAKKFAQDVYAASWALKDNGVPDDYTSDAYWP